MTVDTSFKLKNMNCRRISHGYYCPFCNMLATKTLYCFGARNNCNFKCQNAGLRCAKALLKFHNRPLPQCDTIDVTFTSDLDMHLPYKLMNSSERNARTSTMKYLTPSLLLSKKMTLNKLHIPQLAIEKPDRCCNLADFIQQKKYSMPNQNVLEIKQVLRQQNFQPTNSSGCVILKFSVDDILSLLNVDSFIPSYLGEDLNQALTLKKHNNNECEFSIILRAIFSSNGVFEKVNVDVTYEDQSNKNVAFQIEKMLTRILNHFQLEEHLKNDKMSDENSFNSYSDLTISPLEESVPYNDVNLTQTENEISPKKKKPKVYLDNVTRQDAGQICDDFDFEDRSYHLPRDLFCDTPNSLENLGFMDVVNDPNNNRFENDVLDKGMDFEEGSYYLPTSIFCDSPSTDNSADIEQSQAFPSSSVENAANADFKDGFHYLPKDIFRDTPELRNDVHCEKSSHCEYDGSLGQSTETAVSIDDFIQFEDESYYLPKNIFSDGPKLDKANYPSYSLWHSSPLVNEVSLESAVDNCFGSDKSTNVHGVKQYDLLHLHAVNGSGFLKVEPRHFKEPNIENDCEDDNISSMFCNLWNSSNKFSDDLNSSALLDSFYKTMNSATNIGFVRTTRGFYTNAARVASLGNSNHIGTGTGTYDYAPSVFGTRKQNYCENPESSSVHGFQPADGLSNYSNNQPDFFSQHKNVQNSVRNQIIHPNWNVLSSNPHLWNNLKSDLCKNRTVKADQNVGASLSHWGLGNPMQETTSNRVWNNVDERGNVIQDVLNEQDRMGTFGLDSEVKMIYANRPIPRERYEFKPIDPVVPVKLDKTPIMTRSTSGTLYNEGNKIMMFKHHLDTTTESNTSHVFQPKYAVSKSDKGCQTSIPLCSNYADLHKQVDTKCQSNAKRTSEGHSNLHYTNNNIRSCINVAAKKKNCDRAGTGNSQRTNSVANDQGNGTGKIEISDSGFFSLQELFRMARNTNIGVEI